MKHLLAGRKRLAFDEFPTTRVDWKENVIRALLDAGSNGIGFTEIYAKHARGIPADMTKEFLETYRVQGGLQSFSFEGKTVWRATSALPDLV